MAIALQINDFLKEKGGEDSLRIGGKNPRPAQLVKSHYLVRFRRNIFHFHPWRPNRHSRHTQPDDVRFFFQHSHNFCFGNMSFYYVAIDDGRMAGLKMFWNFVMGLNLRNITDFLHFYG